MRTASVREHAPSACPESPTRCRMHATRTTALRKIEGRIAGNGHVAIPGLPLRSLPEKRQMIHSRSHRRRGVQSVLVFILLAGISGTTLADQSPALDRLDLSLGGYYADIATTISASTPQDEFHDHSNLEDELGFRRHKTVPRVRLNFLIGDSQGFSFDYFSVNRAHGQTLERAFSYGGNHYAAMATVQAKLDFDFGSAAYRWWFGQRNNAFGLGLGGAWYRVQARISGSATVNGKRVGDASAGTGTHAWAPELQLGWRHAFNDHWRIYADASGVMKNGGRLYGHIYKVDLGVDWYPWANLGVGVEYGYTRIKLNQHRHAYDDSLDMRLSGPSMFVKLRL